jgi:hypothetical protein
MNKLLERLNRIAKALKNEGCPTMAQVIEDAIKELEDKERELDNLYRDMAGADI